MNEYVLYCDESASDGKIYTDFFGGCILKEQRRIALDDALNEKKSQLGIHAEIKWTKVTENYLRKYQDIIHLFFDYVRAGDIRVRIMFRKESLSYSYNKEDRYFKLYYQFLKHSFGFMAPETHTGSYYVRFYLDELPDKGARSNEFKDFLCKLPAIREMSGSGIHIRKNDIGEIRSHDHVILQCIDVILGAMQFKLNRLDRIIPEGKTRRGHRTVAKEKLYKYILSEIQTIHPNFNVGVSTGFRNYDYPHWDSPYEHWCFVPNELK